ncbi:MAG TPA: pyrroloquinoline quinone biosynthesis protein PqqE [Polyangia bacterium]|nr:pyrroloquinoline quinone biosynthesis protein PqqE [Polyangia bacterium]
MTPAGPRPFTLIAELTYRCPLRCPYCSNPVDLERHAAELETALWQRVLGEAAELGVVQVHFTGGEPLVRDDLEELVRAARALDLYTNLITSGLPLERARLDELAKAGLDHVQLSIQDVSAEASDRMAGLRSWDAKLKVAEWVKAAGRALTINVVLQRENLDRVEQVVALAEQLGADRLELANTQYQGWALPNRAALLPTAAQLERARAAAERARARLAGRMQIAFVLPDYYAQWPKACMDGWGQRFVVVAPDGVALPCHAAHTIAGLEWESVRARPLGSIWRDSPGFNRFRGDAWMPEPCRSCPRKSIDFGGCRCQAFHLLGDAALTDPACSLSPHHGLIEAARAQAAAAEERPQLLYRGPLRRPSGG